MSLPPISGLAGLHLQPGMAKAQPDNHAVPTPDDMKLRVSNEPLSLIYHTAIQQLNERLQASEGPDAIQKAADSGMDFSPQAVADRILSFATAGFSGYQERHPDDEPGARLDGFMSMIRGAIDQGFAEARKILDGLGVLSGSVKTNADQTYQLIQDGLDRFEQDSREPGS